MIIVLNEEHQKNLFTYINKLPYEYAAPLVGFFAQIRKEEEKKDTEEANAEMQEKPKLDKIKTRK